MVAVLTVGSAAAWGRIGHATVAKIAENHLTKRAKKQITKYLHGESIVKWATYADDSKPELLVDLLPMMTVLHIVISVGEMSMLKIAYTMSRR